MVRKTKTRIKLEEYQKPKYVNYILSEHHRKRRYALKIIIKYEAYKKKISIRAAAVSKKRRLNVLRMYRRYNYKSQCMDITRDMRYLDREYDLGKTNNIC